MMLTTKHVSVANTVYIHGLTNEYHPRWPLGYPSGVWNGADPHL